ncbi:MAG: thioredoxin family protein [Planctomycetota bacterium]|jgi:thioredoxin 1|nr:thioredoxin family protein [Planctomycetota bacterium]
MPEGIMELTAADFAEKTARGVFLVDFYGSWCPPCRALEPELVRLAEFFRGRARIARINVDDHSEAAVDNQVEEIPTLIFFRDGREMKRLFGAHSFESLSGALAELIPGDGTEGISGDLPKS